MSVSGRIFPAMQSTVHCYLWQNSASKYYKYYIWNCCKVCLSAQWLDAHMGFNLCGFL